jgi:hypothetical protein
VGILTWKNIIEEPNSQIERAQSSFPSGKQIGIIVAAFRFLHQKFAKFHSESSRNFLNAKHYYPESAQQGTYAMNECIFQTK